MRNPSLKPPDIWRMSDGERFSTPAPLRGSPRGDLVKAEIFKAEGSTMG
jgi:hypothetical protein